MLGESKQGIKMRGPFVNWILSKIQGNSGIGHLGNCFLGDEKIKAMLDIIGK